MIISGAQTTPKPSEPEQVLFQSRNVTEVNNKSKTPQRCNSDMKFTVKGIQTASYSELLSELKSHTHDGCPLKCRKESLTMKDVPGLRKHYIEVHGARPLRGVKGKSSQI